MESIPISREGGLEPRLCFCPRCGGDSPECLTIGAGIVKVVAGERAVYCYGGEAFKALRELGRGAKIVPLEPDERVPGELCPRCQQELEEWDEIVLAGGLYWHCTECGAEGVLRPCDYARDVREMALESGRIEELNDPLGTEVGCGFHRPLEVGPQG